MNQSAVEFYAENAMKLEIERLHGKISTIEMLNKLSSILIKAKEMEKQQIKFFFDKGHLYFGCQYGFEEIYLKTFNQEK
jgi:hypothetical protein